MGSEKYRFKKGSRSSPATEFKKGQIPWNVRNREEYLEKLKLPKAQGMRPTQFKKGAISKNHKPVGTVTFRRCRGKKGYCYIKIAEPNHWELYHLFVWQKENGPLPTGHCLRFKNGDQTDCRLSNLELISRAQNARLNQNYETDKYIASTLARKSNNSVDKNMHSVFMKNPDILDLKRNILKLRRALDGRAKRGKETRGRAS